MINIRNKITELRKNKGWSQENLAKKIGSSRIMIGKYERGDNLPSIEVVVKLAQIFEVSVDYLLDQGANASFDKKMMNRLEKVESLPVSEKERIFDYIDLVIRDSKARLVYQ